MSFCGHCGFQLAPDDTRCPRCGAIVEPEATVSQTPTEVYPDDATVESSSYQPDWQNQYESQVTNAPPMSSGQQKLVLGPSRYGSNIEGANEATSMMNAPVYQGAPHTSAGASYPNAQDLYPQSEYPAYAGSGVGYPAYPEPAKPRKGPRTFGLVIILLGILLILGALVLFALQHGILGKPGIASPGNTTSTAVATTPTEQAESVIQRYYASVTSRDYATAYHLWKNNTQKFVDFQNGYRYTKSADVTFGTPQTRANDSIYLPVTITATEIVAATQKTRQGVYTGYYVVQKQADGTWLIVNGDLRAA